MTQQFQFHYLCQKITLPQLHKEACTRMSIEAFFCRLFNGRILEAIETSLSGGIAN